MSFSEWKEYFLGDLVENLSSKRVPLSSRQREGRKGIYPYYGAQGIIDYIDDYIFDGEYLLVAEDGNNLKERKEDIAQIAKGKFWVNNHAHVLINNSYSDIKFIKYYLNQLDITPYITGSAQPKLNKANLSKIKVIAPTKSEQISISNFLGMLDEKIELNNQMNETLEEMAQALFKRWFVDFEFPNEEGQPYKSSGGEMVESELGMIPKGWKVVTLDEIIATISVKHSFNKEELIFLNTSDILNGEVLHSNYSSVRGLPGQAKKSIQKDDILYSEIRPQNKRFAYVNFDASDYVVSTKLMVLRSKGILHPKLIYLFLTNEKVIEHLQMIAESRSGTFPQITFKELSNIKLNVPLEESLSFVESSLIPLINKIFENKKENRELIEIRDALLPKLMSGEIRVSDLC